MVKLNLPPRVATVCQVIHALTDTPHLVEIDKETVTVQNSVVLLCIMVFLIERSSSVSVSFSGYERHNLMFSNTRVITNTR